MSTAHEWSSSLHNHPIFTPSKRASASGTRDQEPLELSTRTLTSFTGASDDDDESTPIGRRQVMLIRDNDLIVASGSELRITSLGDLKLEQGTSKGYKTLHAPNIEFEIQQLSLNPNGKLLAVAGARQVAVVVLPRAGYGRLVPTALDCKSIQIGTFYHATRGAPPIAKVDWHPWGEAGSVLMVMTTDGKLREYDISLDPEEPQQVLSFVPEKIGGRYLAQDPSEREVASFTLGRGRADWGPLTVYALMKSGDVYAICPYMPKNASVPSSYVHALECFVAAKQEFLNEAQDLAASTAERQRERFSTVYDYQSKYVSSLLKQLPPGTAFPAPSRSVLMHPPSSLKNPPLRQGPFLLQPAPRTLDGSEGGDATDILYASFGDLDDDEATTGDTDQIGVVLIAYQDGKVDVCLDVEKVEAKWQNKQSKRPELPMLAVYESIDLGTVKTLSATEPSALDLVSGNHPVLYPDPMHEDTIYVYHAFGVHSLDLGPVLTSLEAAVRDDGSDTGNALECSRGTDVRPVVSTFSVERKSSNPVTAVAIPNDVYMTYSIFVLTSAGRVVSFPLTVRSDHPTPSSATETTAQDTNIDDPLPEPNGPPAYVSLLSKEPFSEPPILSRSVSGLPSNPRLALPKGSQDEFVLTPDTLRFLGSTVEQFRSQIRDVQLAHQAAEGRVGLQQQEFARQQATCGTMLELVEQLKGPRQLAAREKLARLQDSQLGLISRSDRVLQAMMQKVSPELSEHEMKWFKELSRMKEEVKGAGRFDQSSLAARIKLLEREFTRLGPSLKEMHQKEVERKKLSRADELGTTQAFELGERSNADRTRIESLQRQITDLASRLDVSLQRPQPLC
ncbi:hypothetical protein PUNSTDRAFT_100184 [Punctularia strigosozonata HHB-11173 SS5]|uniref:uncharacterized protein n=1 Tax=Punctularia strigosozonata (strain HHB-11173) TaxID=741275 RepID=UPI0004416A53|nr:uncharacterized protein PUNSTDRAFT_100184 [Punctularia strigosozonata HHB-11173 SS5]EIN10572.1 hypothetical protein PUNSTDRAFT_100184 [Punctularia strigosozonata HHB-11173 SS5]